MFITATMNSIDSGTPIHAGMSSTPRNGNVTWSIQTPNMHGIDAATNCPASFTDGERPAEVVHRADDGRDGSTQQHSAALAREVEERQRRHEDRRGRSRARRDEGSACG